MSPAAHRVGVDVGGTSTKAVRVDAGGHVVAERRAATTAPDPSGAAVVESIAALVASLDVPDDVPVGVVVPGVVDEDRGLAVLSVALGWRDLDLRARLEERLGRPVAFGHDVRAGAVAEVRSGAAQGADGVVAFMAVGTGLSAAVLVDGRPVVSGGWAGEIGQLVLADGPFAGSRVEEVASATGTARRAGEPDARAVAARVAAGDPAAVEVWRTTASVLAGALAGLVVTVAPSTIVVGGGLALAGDLLLEPIRAELARRVAGLRVPRLVVAHHGDGAGALGAAMLAGDAALTS
ncbi:ROK family protein [Cellulomonas sp. ATA003]|uniref:ROK family protein n=1 Tax=Cellulomonas sp. ATA003 TaxID=3073064 RepID=UPI0028736A88|nr:ROK family protein [Cellulomonas sp. ATA003]WNB86517.1 ROK family protein [Cellulomonas sp. ATA003]